MAIDSEQKRKSAATVGPPTNAPSVVPDSSISGADRQQIAWSYSGIAAENPAGFVVAWAMRLNHLLDGSTNHAV
jgi:hypothetical protein